MIQAVEKTEKVISYSSAYPMVEHAYVQTKNIIAYEAMHWIMVSIALFLMFMKLFDEYQKFNLAQTRMDWGAYFRQTWIFVVVCVFACGASDIFNLIESVLSNAQEELLKAMNFNKGDAAYQGVKAMAKELIDRIPNVGILDFDLLAFLGGLVGAIVATILVPIYGYIYFFYLAGRSMWLLMLDFVAPIAIMTAIHENTRTYFYTWLKNMFTCYMLLPMFLLADMFSNFIIYQMYPNRGGNVIFGVGGSSDAHSAIFVTSLVFVCGIWMKIKMFSVVRQKTMQLF